MDFALTREGDLSLSASGSLEIAKNDDLKVQNAHCRVHSVKSDWYIDNVGADLESLIGLPNETDTVELGKTLIMSALTEHGLYKSEDIYIEIESVQLMTIRYSVYLKTAERRARLLQITIDALDGVSVQEGGAYVNQS